MSFVTEAFEATALSREIIFITSTLEMKQIRVVSSLFPDNNYALANGVLILELPQGVQDLDENS